LPGGDKIPQGVQKEGGIRAQPDNKSTQLVINTDTTYLQKVRRDHWPHPYGPYASILDRAIANKIFGVFCDTPWEIPASCTRKYCAYLLEACCNPFQNRQSTLPRFFTTANYGGALSNLKRLATILRVLLILSAMQIIYQTAFLMSLRFLRLHPSPASGTPSSMTSAW